MKILQINCNKSRPAQDLAVATARNHGVGFLIISEPNINAIIGRKDWFHDSRMKTAIHIVDNNIRITNQGHGTGFTYVSTEKLFICSCYSSGNEDIEKLEEMLFEIQYLVRRGRLEAIIAGDFNAKSALWGMPLTDARGQILLEWVEANDMVVVNEGVKPTFVSENYGSILDLTIATENIAHFVTNWKVLDEETLSDHNYIEFSVFDKNDKKYKKWKKCEGWQTNKLDHTKLQYMLENLEDNDANADVKSFSDRLNKICDEVMPRRRRTGRKQPVYWWSDEISELRKDCIRKRRAHTRSAGRDSANLNHWEAYKASKTQLRNKIREAKQKCWAELCRKVDSDIWGDGYRIVMKGMLGFPPKTNLSMQMLEEVVMHLFPKHPEVNFNRLSNPRALSFSEEEMLAASRKIKLNKAPGPGKIPPEIIKYIALNKPSYLLSLYNRLAAELNFPSEWKQAILLLIRKENKPLNDPSSFRPICLLDVEGKLYEQLLLQKLKQEIERTGGLSDRQYGFREGRQTVDAINHVLRLARDAAAYSHPQRRLCVVITVDVRNAFNSASWQCILDELRKREVNESLISIIASYLSNRTIILVTDECAKTVRVNSGVPQGSVLGPTLWNVIYDGLLVTEMPEGCTLIGFADDIALVVTAKSEESLMSTANLSLVRIWNWMRCRRLELAPEKTEAALLTTKRKIAPITFELQGIQVRTSRAVKYLGVWLDNKMTFSEHISRTVLKGQRTLSALTSLMPNTKGPRASKRKLLASVVHSQILYGAPSWHNASQNKKLIQKLGSLQRLLAIKICSAYRTVSTDGVGVIAGIPPIKWQIMERTERYEGTPKVEAYENMMTRWQTQWNDAPYGRWTYQLIPDIRQWVERPYGEVDYYLTQVLSGHGCFKKYLFSRRRAETSDCNYCRLEDTPEHTLFVCPRWIERRTTYTTNTGEIFNVENMRRGLISKESKWTEMYRVIRYIIEEKEKESR